MHEGMERRLGSSCQRPAWLLLSLGGEGGILAAAPLCSLLIAVVPRSIPISRALLLTSIVPAGLMVPVVISFFFLPFLGLDEMVPLAIHLRGFLSSYPGHTTPAPSHLWQKGCPPSQTRRRRRHSQQCRFGGSRCGLGRECVVVLLGWAVCDDARTAGSNADDCANDNCTVLDEDQQPAPLRFRAPSEAIVVSLSQSTMLSIDGDGGGRSV